jgi:glucose-6-phosphate isomerase
VTNQILYIGGYDTAVKERLGKMEEDKFSQRLWQKDPRLWKIDPESQRVIHNSLGWLTSAEKMEKNLYDLLQFVTEVRESGFRHVVLMGMGGSSLAPLTLQRIFHREKGMMPLTVLDTTDPATILKIEREIPLRETLFINASKSGTTAEPLAFGEYFFAKISDLKGKQAGDNFVAITDPGTSLMKLGQKRGFRRIFPGCEDIGGRYSALSPFGLVPAALMGMNVGDLLSRALRMIRACGPAVPVPENPAIVLGAVMGELALRGRDKLTLCLPESLLPFGLWLEQLLAESTGKEGKGILPIDNEPLGVPSKYGEDRFFIYFRRQEEGNEPLEKFIGELQQAGKPVLTIQMESLLDVVQEFFRWEMATATAGAVLGINPFDQPNVQESKDNTNRLLDAVRKEGKLPDKGWPSFQEGNLRFFTTQGSRNGPDLLKKFFARTRPGDFLALQAYLPEEQAITQALQAIRKCLRDRLGLATTLGYGPRFLHSTGQFHKGGPDTGLFLQLTADDAEDAPIPGTPYTFGLFKQAQALGDLEALRKHGRRVIRIHLVGDVRQGLDVLTQLIEEVWQ